MTTELTNRGTRNQRTINILNNLKNLASAKPIFMTGNLFDNL